MVYVDIFGLIVAAVIIGIVAWPDIKNAPHHKAMQLTRKAEDLIRPVSFSDTSMQKGLVRYFEDRLSGSGTPRRTEIISFYKDESRLLYAVMIVAYESLLFSYFTGTDQECSYQAKEKLREIFSAAANRLAQMGYDPAKYIRKADGNILAVEQFCADRNGSFRLFD